MKLVRFAKAENTVSNRESMIAMSWLVLSLWRNRPTNTDYVILSGR